MGWRTADDPCRRTHPRCSHKKPANTSIRVVDTRGQRGNDKRSTAVTAAIKTSHIFAHGHRCGPTSEGWFCSSTVPLAACVGRFASAHDRCTRNFCTRIAAVRFHPWSHREAVRLRRVLHEYSGHDIFHFFTHHQIIRSTKHDIFSNRQSEG